MIGFENVAPDDIHETLATSLLFRELVFTLTNSLCSQLDCGSEPDAKSAHRKLTLVCGCRVVWSGFEAGYGFLALVTF